MKCFHLVTQSLWNQLKIWKKSQMFNDKLFKTKKKATTLIHKAVYIDEIET